MKIVYINLTNHLTHLLNFHQNDTHQKQENDIINFIIDIIKITRKIANICKKIHAKSVAIKESIKKEMILSIQFCIDMQIAATL